MEKIQAKKNIGLNVRHFIYTTFTKTSRPPTTSEVAHYFKTSIAVVESVFEGLAEAHHIVLAPGSHSIWMAHPFSALPTNYVAEVGGKRYWGNWIWDVLGIAAILQQNARGYTPCGCGACGEKLEIEIIPSSPVDTNWIVHFVVPAKHFWDKIGYTWATILPFSSKEHLDSWLSRYQMKVGYIMPMESCWKLAQKWYTGRLERDWQRPNQEKVQQLFSSLGLKGDFWRVDWKSLSHRKGSNLKKIVYLELVSLSRLALCVVTRKVVHKLSLTFGQNFGRK